MKVFTSSYDETIHIAFVNKTDEIYESLEPLFKEFGIAFYNTKYNYIMINEEEIETINEFQYIEAHEIAHKQLNHPAGRTMKHEKESDQLAYQLVKNNSNLKEEDRIKTLQLIEEEFYARYNEHIEIN